MLLEMIKRGYHIDEVICCDTGMEFPAMVAHINKLKIMFTPSLIGVGMKYSAFSIAMTTALIGVAYMKSFTGFLVGAALCNRLENCAS